VVFLVHETLHSGRGSVKLIRAVALRTCIVVNKRSILYGLIPMFRSSVASLPRRGISRAVNWTALAHHANRLHARPLLAATL
jgi:hypothetical protein